MTMQEAYRAKYEAKIKEFDAEIDKVAAKMDEAEADAKIRLRNYIEDLRSQRDTFTARFEDFNKAGAEALKEMQQGFDRAWDKLSAAFGKTGEKNVH